MGAGGNAGQGEPTRLDLGPSGDMGAGLPEGAAKAAHALWEEAVPTARLFL